MKVIAFVLFSLAVLASADYFETLYDTINKQLLPPQQQQLAQIKQAAETKSRQLLMRDFAYFVKTLPQEVQTNIQNVKTDLLKKVDQAKQQLKSELSEDGQNKLGQIEQIDANQSITFSQLKQQIVAVIQSTSAADQQVFKNVAKNIFDYDLQV